MEGGEGARGMGTAPVLDREGEGSFGGSVFGVRGFAVRVRRPPVVARGLTG